MQALHRTTRGGRAPGRRRTSHTHSKQKRSLNQEPTVSIIILSTSTFVLEQAPLSSHDVVGGIQPIRSSTIGKPSESVADRIAKLAAEWRTETGHLSSIERKAIHPAYQSIIATGKQGIPYVLRELRERGGYWFWALHFMSGGIELNASSPQGLREMWLAWGKQQGYVGL